MPSRRLRTAAAALLLAAGLVAAARPTGPLPALGALLDPARGIWAAARQRPIPETGESLPIPGLVEPVRVVYDRRQVPHVFARHVDDAYRALGYVVARDRLLQLEVQTLAASGRLTELAGARALPLDREIRRLGLPRAAERKLVALDTAGATSRALRAYADGVNAWIDGLDAAALPPEFKLLGRRPTRWEPINSVHLLERMGWTLAYIAPELDRAAAAARVGGAAAAALFPTNSPLVEPIQPNGQGAPRADMPPLPPPGAPEPGALATTLALADWFPSHAAARRAAAALDGSATTMASNNWAVAPARTAAGHALLAGDPHLELTLPSIWYEAHLVVPGQLDVYGVTIPGAPGIIIGFNRDVAWTFTNTGADVLDFWAESVDEPRRPTRYRVDGQWRPVQTRVEVYRGPGGEPIAADTLRFTHRGPLRREGTGADARWLSMRWTVLEPSDEIAAFHGAARARSVADFQAAMAAHYWTPAQNMLVADRDGRIAIRSTGHFPVRAGDGDGATVRDGSRSAEDWQGLLPVDRYPQALNPAQGYLASANQQPVDPRAVPGYWGGSYDPWRAMHLNRLLRGTRAVAPDSMRRWQTDPGSARADWFVPHFVRAARAPAPAGVDGARLAEAGRLLAGWDRRYTRENDRAVLFEWAMRELAVRTWDELDLPGRPPEPGRDPFGEPTTQPARAAWPSSATLAHHLADSAGAWWDVRATADRREDRDAVLAAALVAALDSCTRRYGPPDAGGWRWSRHRHAQIGHLLQFPALSARDLPVQGGPETLSPSSGSGRHGASWRMVVELGPAVRAWGTYPGGQSGDPTNPGYRDRLPRWLAGELDPLAFPRTADEVVGGRTLTLTPAR